eukprot:m.364343 g.364343  ORF g.364343 m.364343 type:complete len:431 (-) comp19968_c0_seq10:1394-2686(-)
MMAAAGASELQLGWQPAKRFPTLIFPGQRQVVRVGAERWDSWLQAAEETSPGAEPGHMTLAFVFSYADVGTIVRLDSCDDRTYHLHVTGLARFAIRDLRMESNGRLFVLPDLLVDPEPGSIMAMLRGTSENQPGELLTEAKSLVAAFTALHKTNSLWQKLMQRGAAPDFDDATSVSFWLCAVLQGVPAVPQQELLDMFRITSAPTRLRTALALFKAHPPVRKQTQSGIKSARENTTAHIRERQRCGGLRPIPRHFSLTAHAARAAAEHVYYQSQDPDMLVSLGKTLCMLGREAVQAIADHLAIRGLMTLPLLCCFRGTPLGSMQLIGSDVENSWLEQVFAFQPNELHPFPCLSELHLLACYRVTDEMVLEGESRWCQRRCTDQVERRDKTGSSKTAARACVLMSLASPLFSKAQSTCSSKCVCVFFCLFF